MRLHAQRTILRPAEDVADFFFDVTNNPSWQGGMRRCEWTTGSPVEVGSIYEQEARFLGRPVISTFRVVDLVPSRLMRIETIEGTFPITVTRTVEPVDAGTTRVSAEIVGSPGGLLGMIAPLTRRFAQRSVDSDYDRLVEVLSSR